MSYLLPPNETTLTGACAAADTLCVWNERAAYRWHPPSNWTSLTAAPTALDSGFALQSGILAGADTHVGFLPSDAPDWAWWHDLSAFTDAHPMYGDLLLCTDRSGPTTTYSLFSITGTGLDLRSEFDADELADPVAGWSSPPNAERLLLLGDGGLWALDAPYTPDDRQHLVSFDDVDLPLLEDIPGPFQPGVATVVIPRRSQTALRLDLSDGTGHATGLKHLPGGTALWSAYLHDDRSRAAHIVNSLASLPLPSPDASLRLHDILVDGNTIQALATSAGLHVPEGTAAPTSPLDAPLDPAALATWMLWLDLDDAVETACRALCQSAPPDDALAESICRFAGTAACDTLFELLSPSQFPTDPTEPTGSPIEGLRALAAAFGPDVAALVTDTLSADDASARAAACAMAGATDKSSSALWADRASMPEDQLRTNAHHDHPAVRTAARDACHRLGLAPPEEAPADYDRRQVQSSQPDSPK